MQNQLGQVTHNYWHANDTYYRRPLGNCSCSYFCNCQPAQYWDGYEWIVVLPKAVA